MTGVVFDLQLIFAMHRLFQSLKWAGKVVRHGWVWHGLRHVSQQLSCSRRSRISEEPVAVSGGSSGRFR